MSQMNGDAGGDQMQQAAAADMDIRPPRRASSAVRAAPRRCALGGRLAGPGGYYNIGNGLGLLGGIALTVVASDAGTFETGARAAFDYLAGSASAISVSVAMLVFFWSGEAYHRAFSGGFPLDRELTRLGDLWSGWGALALGFGLFLLGEPLLAATAGLLHAFGKFGSALHPSDSAKRPGSQPDLYRTAVLVSRLPAIALTIMSIAAAFATPGGPAPMALAGPGLLLVCYLLWAKAGLLPLQG